MVKPGLPRLYCDRMLLGLCLLTAVVVFVAWWTK